MKTLIFLFVIFFMSQPLQVGVAQKVTPSPESAGSEAPNVDSLSSLITANLDTSQNLLIEKVSTLKKKRQIKKTRSSFSSPGEVRAGRDTIYIDTCISHTGSNYIFERITDTIEVAPQVKPVKKLKWYQKIFKKKTRPLPLQGGDG